MRPMLVSASRQITAIVLMLMVSGAACAQGMRPQIGKPLGEVMKLMEGDFLAAVAKLGEADAVKDKTPFEEYQVAKYVGLIALQRPVPDYAAAADAYNRQVASGAAPDEEKVNMYTTAIRLNYRTMNYAKLIHDGTALQMIRPLDVVSYRMLAEAYYNTMDYGRAVETAKGALASEVAAGMRPTADLLDQLNKAEASLRSQAAPAQPSAN